MNAKINVVGWNIKLKAFLIESIEGSYICECSGADDGNSGNTAGWVVIFSGVPICFFKIGAKTVFISGVISSKVFSAKFRMVPLEVIGKSKLAP